MSYSYYKQYTILIIASSNNKIKNNNNNTETRWSTKTPLSVMLIFLVKSDYVLNQRQLLVCHWFMKN